jgi:leader peptidase (prepilin peptidase) / N-methyltransferase
VSAAIVWTRARPLGSLFAAVIAAVVLVRYGPGAPGLIAAFAGAVLVVLSQIDIESRRLPNRIVLPAAAIVLAARLASAPGHWAAWVGAALGVAAFLLLFSLVFPAGLGMGDVKLALLLGAALGRDVIAALVVGPLCVVPVALVLLARKGPAAASTPIPFGPFLAIGAIVVALT